MTAAPPRPLRLTASGGVTLAADAWGDPSAPVVLLLHGGGQTRHAWSGTGERLAADGWRAVSLDLRGHGESDWAADGDYSLEAFVRDVAAITPSFGPPAPVLVGASLGGMSSLIAEGERAGRVVARALVLVDIGTHVEADGVARIIGFMTAQPNGFASVAEAADAVAAYLPHRPRPKDLDGLRKNLREGADGRWRWHWDPRFLDITRAPRWEGGPERLAAAARAIRVPTLLVRGVRSDILSEEGARAFLDLVPHARYVDVRDAGHMVAGDRNDVFAQAVVDFLREHLGGP